MIILKVNKDYYVIYYNGMEFCKVSKNKNDIEKVKKYYHVDYTKYEE